MSRPNAHIYTSLHEVKIRLLPFVRCFNGDHRGHGTYVDGEDVVASVAGTLERVNKLVTVRALKTR